MGCTVLLCNAGLRKVTTGHFSRHRMLLACSSVTVEYRAYIDVIVFTQNNPRTYGISQETHCIASNCRINHKLGSVSKYARVMAGVGVDYDIYLSGLSLTRGPRQRSHSRVRVPWDSRPYFTVWNSRLPFSSPPTTRRATVDVFNPATTRDTFLVESSLTVRLTVSPPVSLGIKHPSLHFTSLHFLFWQTLRVLLPSADSLQNT
jgi:hypothetical protein